MRCQGGDKMETKADKVAAIALGTIFFFLGIWGLFTFPSDWEWYQKVLLEISVFGCSLGCFAALVFGVPGSRK